MVSIFIPTKIITSKPHYIMVPGLHIDTKNVENI